MSALHLSDLLRRDVASDPVITGVTADSRKVAPGALFVALPGSAADGRAYERSAIAEWLVRRRSSPLTNCDVGTAALAPDLALRSRVDRWARVAADAGDAAAETPADRH